MLENGLKYLSDNLPLAIDFGIRLLLTFIFFIVGTKCIKWTIEIARKSMAKSNLDVGVMQFICSVLRTILYGLLISTIAVRFGIESTSVAALLGSVGVAVGLALQGSLSNFAGGILILILKPFVVGDYILEDTNKNEGVVKEIQIFYTKLQSVDNRIVVIPNGMLANSSLTNITGQEMRRIDLKIDIAYSADLLKAKDILMNILLKNEEVCKENDIVVVVDELGSHSVILACKAWVETSLYWKVRWSLLEEIKLEFDRNDVEIPFEQIQVHINKS